MGPSPTTSLAIAVADAGGLGSVSTPGLLTPLPELRTLLGERMARVARETTGRFAFNVPVGTLANGDLLPSSEACIDEAIELKARHPEIAERFVAITTSAGDPTAFNQRIKDAGLIHIAKVGSLRHALKAQDAGCDIVIASGYEMGGHTHVHPVHTMVLAPQVIDALDIPVIVSGGIFDGRGVAAVLAMGAAAVAMGTRFIATVEHEWHHNYKQAIVDSPEWGDTIYKGYYAPSRAIHSKGLDEDLPAVTPTLTVDELNLWKEDRGYVAQMEGDVVNGIITSGQCAAAIHDIPSVAELIERIWTQASGLLHDAAASIDSVPVTASRRHHELVRPRQRGALSG